MTIYLALSVALNVILVIISLIAIVNLTVYRSHNKRLHKNGYMYNLSDMVESENVIISIKDGSVDINGVPVPSNLAADVMYCIGIKMNERIEKSNPSQQTESNLIKS